MNDKSINPVVLKLQGINLTGNVTPITWFTSIRKQSGKSDMLAVNILADIVYWYRPTIIRDEITGHVIGIKQKFKADKLQKQYTEYAKLFGVSKTQVKEAFDNLVRLNLITREFRNFGTARGDSFNASNVMYVEPILEKILAVTQVNSIPLKKGGMVPPKSEGMVPQEKGGTYTETSTENTTENTTTTAKGGFKKVSSSILESIKENGEKDAHKKTADSSVTVESEMSNGLVFDFAFKDWSTAQRQRASKILKDVPEIDKQVILDELNSAVKKGTVKQIWRYLTTLVRKYQQDEFVPTSDLSEHRVKSKPKRVSVKDCPLCPLCDKRGLIKFVDERTGQFETVICCHDAVKIEAMRNGRRIEN